MIAIVDYGVGNLYSLQSSLNSLGVANVVTSCPKILGNADKIILPGVGAFGDAVQKLHDSKLFNEIVDMAKDGKPLMGICLGMQLLFEKSYEFGEHKGLGLIPGEVITMQGVVPSDFKIPHIGWNALKKKNDDKILEKIDSGNHVYFVHSYYAKTDEKYLSSTTEYGVELTASVFNNNVCGTQFHPEKSGKIGLEILRSFCE